MTPDWNPPSQVGPGFLSYIGFRFTNLSEYTGPEIIRLNWKTAPPDYQYLWLAVADFATPSNL